MLERERTQLERDYSERHERDRMRLLAELNSARSKGAAELSQTRGENERLRQQELSVNSFVPVHRDSIRFCTVQYTRVHKPLLFLTWSIGPPSILKWTIEHSRLESVRIRANWLF